MRCDRAMKLVKWGNHRRTLILKPKPQPSPLSDSAPLQDFCRNFKNDAKVKIPWVRRDLSGPRVLTMEWIDGLRCTDPRAIVNSGIDVEEFIRGGVVTGLRQLLEVSLSPPVQGVGLGGLHGHVAPSQLMEHHLVMCSIPCSYRCRAASPASHTVRGQRLRALRLPVL